MATADVVVAAEEVFQVEEVEAATTPAAEADSEVDRTSDLDTMPNTAAATLSASLPNRCCKIHGRTSHECRGPSARLLLLSRKTSQAARREGRTGPTTFTWLAGDHSQRCRLDMSPSKQEGLKSHAHHHSDYESLPRQLAAPPRTSIRCGPLGREKKPCRRPVTYSWEEQQPLY